MGYGISCNVLIDVISRVNLYVSPVTSFLDSVYLRCKNGKRLMGPLDEKAFINYKKEVEKRIEVIRIAWKLSEEFGNYKIMEKLKSMEKRKQ